LIFDLNWNFFINHALSATTNMSSLFHMNYEFWILTAKKN
jgi:hypothetical protein